MSGGLAAKGERSAIPAKAAANRRWQA